MAQPLPAYKGDEPYVFVSYSHADEEIVFAEVRWLQDQGINVWYDTTGIGPGSEWNDEIARAIKGADHFLYFITPNSAESEHCRRELNYAQSQSRRVVAVHLEETKLPDGLQLSLENRQAIFKYRLDETEYRLALARALDTDGLETLSPSARFEPSRSRAPWIAKISIAAAALGAIAIAAYWVSRDADIAPSDVRGTPRIAVMPFENRSTSLDDVYFGDGLAEDIATAMSKFSNIVVMPPNVTARFRGSDDNTIARDLDVRYVVRGNVSGQPDRVLVSARLIDPKTNLQLWAQSYNQELQAADLFEIRSEIATQIASTLADATGVVVTIGLQQVRQRQTESMEAYDCVLRGQAYVAIHTDETHRVARDCLERAVQLDPTYASAWAHLAYLYQEEYHHNRNLNPRPLERALDAAQRALELDSANSMGLMALAMTRFSQGEIELALRQLRRALVLNPNDTTMLAALAVNTVFAGHLEEGRALVKRARDLNPAPTNWIYVALGAADYLSGNYERALLELDGWGPAFDTQIAMLRAASLAMVDRPAAAERALEELTAADPAFAENPDGEIRRYFVVPETIAKVREGLVKAGLTDQQFDARQQNF